ncbi:MAG: hypothetical protein EXS09_11220 [Gemmataceae bacterium]|nr:hypothetical protein [Gemmataceae bacterium]
MSYRWIIFTMAATMLGGAAWYFGRPEMPKELTPETPKTSVRNVLPETPKELPPTVIEVIDLASAYEPVREPQLPIGIDPASFLEDSKAPARIPYAVDEENSPQVAGTALLFPLQERILVLPRLVTDGNSVRLDVMPREVK